MTTMPPLDPPDKEAGMLAQSWRTNHDCRADLWNLITRQHVQLRLRRLEKELVVPILWQFGRALSLKELSPRYYGAVFEAADFLQWDCVGYSADSPPPPRERAQRLRSIRDHRSLGPRP